MITNTIACYYSEINKHSDRELIALWCEKWALRGWKPRVLDENDAHRDSRFNRLAEKISRLPSVNPQPYQFACIMRWLAFSLMDGAVSDYDVFPVVDFPPRDFGGFVCGDTTFQPGFVVGAFSDFSRFVDEIIEYSPRPTDMAVGKPHVSDQEIMRSNPARFTAIMPLIKSYLGTEWEKGPLVHFSNDSISHCTHTGTKADKIKAVLDTL